MKFTGERVVPGQVEPDLLNEHLARYHFARQFVRGKRVLDAACGSGYGSAMLAESAGSVVGIDISHEAVGYARANYAAAAAAGAEIDFSEGDCLALPLTDESIDVAVAFEIVEHLKDAAGLLRELRRVLRPGGLLLLSTPNRLYYTEDRGEINPFHEHEYTFEEMDALIAPFFPHRRIIFENHVDGFAISGPGTELSGANVSNQPAASDTAGFDAEACAARITSSAEPTLLTDSAVAASLAERARDAYFFIAICAAQPIPAFSPLLFVPSTGNVLRERESHIRQLERQLADSQAERDAARQKFQEMERELNEFREFLATREKALEAQLAERTAWARNLEQQAVRAQEDFGRLSGEMEDRTAWALKMERELEERTAWALKLNSDMDERTAWALKLDSELAERTAWALKLNTELEERTAWALNLNSEVEELRGKLRAIAESRWFQVGDKLGLAPSADGPGRT